MFFEDGNGVKRNVAHRTLDRRWLQGLFSYVFGLKVQRKTFIVGGGGSPIAVFVAVVQKS